MNTPIFPPKDSDLRTVASAFVNDYCPNAAELAKWRQMFRDALDKDYQEYLRTAVDR